MEDKLKNSLQWIVGILKNHNVPFQITGGFAAKIYGSNRHVNDIDIDIPENNFNEITKDIEPYIVFGPGRYKDKRWDLQLITLDYFGQEIDIGGANETNIYDDAAQRWKHCPSNLETAQIHRVLDLELPVMDPNDLAQYKKLLEGDHQAEDIKAVEEFIANCS